MGINDVILDKSLEAQVSVQRFAEATRAKVIAYLEALKEDIEAQINQADLAGITRTAFKVRRQNALLKDVNGLIDQAHGSMGKALNGELLELADVEAFRTGNILNSVIGANIATVTLSEAHLKELVSKSMIQGAPQKAWWAKQSNDLQHSFMQQIRLGVGQGETNDQLVGRIRGGPTGKRKVVTINGKKKTVREFSGGIMSVSQRQAEALVRTSVQTISNNVQQRMHEENQDVIGGLEWVSTLDARTTPLCRARDKGMWDIKTEEPLPESKIKIPFPGYPPAHFNCRSVIVPITKSWDDLVKMVNNESDVKLTDAQQKAFNNLATQMEDVPVSTRASMDGQAPEGLSYEEWLRGKPVEFQKSVLGPAKYDIWKKDGLSFQDMVSQEGNPLTIQELKLVVGQPMQAPAESVVSLASQEIKKALKAVEDFSKNLPKTDQGDLDLKKITKDELIKLNERQAYHQKTIGDYLRLSRQMKEITIPIRPLPVPVSAKVAVELPKEKFIAVTKLPDLPSERIEKAKLAPIAEALKEVEERAEFVRQQVIKRGVVDVEYLAQLLESDGLGGSVLTEMSGEITDKIKTVQHYMDRIVVGNKNPKIHFETTTRGRSYFTIFRPGHPPTIFLTPIGKDKLSEIAHEWGHFLDVKKNKNLRARVREFLKYRTKGEKLVNLADVSSKFKREDKEMAYLDKFIDPYMGKDYKGASTELLSMGFQMFFTDPIKMATKDPEYFKFIISTVRGWI